MVLWFLPVLGAVGVVAGVAALTGTCFDAGIMSFGCSETQAVKIINRVQSKIKVDVFAKNDHEVIQGSDFQNKMIFRRMHFNCDYSKFTSSQKITGKVFYKVEIDQKVVANVKSVLKNLVTEHVSQLSPASHEFLTRVTNGKNETDLINELHASIDQGLNAQNVARIQQTVSAGNYLEFEDAIFTGKKCDASHFQEIIMEVQANAFIRSVIEAAMQGEIVQALAVNVEQTLTSATGPLTYALFGAGAIGAIVLIIFLVFKFRKMTTTLPDEEAPTEDEED